MIRAVPNVRSQVRQGPISEAGCTDNGLFSSLITLLFNLQENLYKKDNQSHPISEFKKGKGPITPFFSFGHAQAELDFHTCSPNQARTCVATAVERSSDKKTESLSTLSLWLPLSLR